MQPGGKRKIRIPAQIESAEFFLARHRNAISGGARNCHTMKISDGDPVWRSWVWVKLRCFGGGSRILEGLGSSGCGHLIYAYTV